MGFPWVFMVVFFLERLSYGKNSRLGRCFKASRLGGNSRCYDFVQNRDYPMVN